jgi:phosphomannomutase/phosphoglucomutase
MNLRKKMSIFRAYDIRGIFGKDLTPKIAEKIGKAFGSYVGGGRKNLVVGRDCRLSSLELRDAVIKGLTSIGCNVMDIGMVPTPILYFSIHHYKKDGGIMITGSHNPPQYNGFKLCKGKHTLYGDEILELKKIIDRGKFKEEEKGGVEERNIVEEYLNFIKGKVKLEKKLKVVIDAGNGTAGLIAKKLFQDLGCEVFGLNIEPDGNFPKHFPDPTVDSYLTGLIEKVKRERADVGIAYDGDADRLGLVDDLGRIVRGDQALILFSREILKKHRKGKIIFEVKCSHALIEDIKAHNGIGIMYRTGHSFIKKRLKEEKALLAGEMSGHFFFADDYYGYDDGIFASLKMVELLSKNENKLSELVSKIPKYYSTPEIRIHCPDEEKFKIVEEIKKKFQEKGYEVITVDGARIQFDDGWGLVRASNTEPAIILRFEGKTQEKLGEIEKLIKGELRKFSSIAKNL